MPEIQINYLQQKSIVTAAAKKYGIPYGILAGVYGMESDFGHNSSTNTSSGATGPFQFLPSTAKQYGYPLVNTPNVSQFAQQADAAALYLSTLFHQTGSWDTALHSYSGGGYGLAQVNAKAQSLQSGSGSYSGGGVSPSAALGVGSAVGLGAVAGEGLLGAGADATAATEGASAAEGAGASTAASLATKALTSQVGRDISIATVLAWLSTAKNWLRVLEFVGGAIAIYMALKSLAGVDVPSPAAVARKVAV